VGAGHDGKPPARYALAITAITPEIVARAAPDS
jgi:hypothetical protein